jgi:CheY-like chemotaxis protein
MYIMVVEDEEPSRRALITALERMGHKTCWAESGDSALSLMHTEHVDLVLLDLSLGAGMDGWEVARRKSNDPAIARIPVIVTSGLSLEVIHAHDAKNPLAGAMLVIGKPIDLDRLRRAIDMVEKGAQG